VGGEVALVEEGFVVVVDVVATGGVADGSIETGFDVVV